MNFKTFGELAPIELMLQIEHTRKDNDCISKSFIHLEGWGIIETSLNSFSFIKKKNKIGQFNHLDTTEFTIISKGDHG